MWFFPKVTWKSMSILLFIDFFKITFFPSMNLIYWGACVILLDLISGIIKALVRGEFVISQGIRKTLKKLGQYVGVITLLFILSNVFTIDPEATKRMLVVFGDGNDMYIKVLTSIKFINNLVLLIIIYTEALSISENLVAIDPVSNISKYLLRPLHAIISFSLNWNFFKRMADAARNKK